MDCILDNAVTAANWERLNTWLDAPLPRSLEVWCDGGWIPVKESIEVHVSAWCLVLRTHEDSPLYALKRILSSPLLHQRPTWCAFDQDLLYGRWWRSYLAARQTAQHAANTHVV